VRNAKPPSLLANQSVWYVSWEGGFTTVDVSLSNEHSFVAAFFFFCSTSLYRASFVGFSFSVILVYFISFLH
jgi:hypothetical protein